MLSTDNSGLGIELCGDDLLTVAVEAPAAAQDLAAALRMSSDWIDVVPGINSVVVQFDPTLTRIDAAVASVAETIAAGVPRLDVPEEFIEIPVVYGGEAGPDLADVCQYTGLTAEELIALHTSGEYRVDLVGFTPGFVYVGGLDDALSVPRRAEPRQHVPAGSVGIADGRTGLYALPGPGGWPLIGRTSFTLFDAEAADPFPICAGMRVRFRAVVPEEAGS